ncbi:transglutaminase family protein [Jiella endophytica]|uniref:Transglutaminase family protein n=1 Tax=Jiella endophytica TaxID=2558362 RepID=A0A4Y8RI30_9HYPH|nr:transglutaminase family protein [Jiella endophytica]TFF22066.1 transglutaminase family protein [Jiella endophytica]
MRYAIRLKITYDYPAAVTDARHLLRVRPHADAGQAPRNVRLAITPRPDEHARERDFFGNDVDAIAFFAPHTELAVLMEAEVAVERPVPALELSPSAPSLAEEALAVATADGTSPLNHLGASRLIAPVAPLTAYVAETLGDGLAGEAVMALTRRIRDDFAYVPGATSVGTSVAEAFAARRGVCQDFSHVMIAGLRANGIPARYVSGFLRTEPPKGQPRLEGADAMHAWVDVWLGGELGWVGFDPTNGILAGDDHIVVAVGRDYSDALPIGGTFVTAGPQETDHFVDVIPIG